ncbi:hypothetical protein [Kitasatospora sp. McL0602]|uniref:hypothetical protein n=1 Tax=Kitasatospora sp. McL0602 TaxID=3439530 RepID=UPI003F8B1C82
MTVGRDGDDYVLGRPDLGLYVCVPEPGAVFVTTLQGGGSLAEASERAAEAAGEPVDGEDFLAGLIDCGLLDPAATGDATSTAKQGREIRWIEGVSPRTARRLFGRTAWALYTAAAFFVLGTLLLRADLRPSWEDVWFLPEPVLSTLVYLPVGLAIGACHEAWHWLAGRAVGVPATFRVSHRGFLLVFETDLTQIVTVPRRRRYGPFLAGMAFDVTVLAVALVLRLMYRQDLLELPSVVNRFLGALAFSQVVSIGFQWAALFFRSDGYAVIANALGCHNLYRATWLTTKQRLLRLSEAEDRELAACGDRDRAVARWFGLGYAAGLLAMVWMFFNLTLPNMIGMLTWVLHDAAGHAVNTVGFWESVAVLLLIGTQYGLPPVLAWRERRLRREGRLR